MDALVSWKSLSLHAIRARRGRLQERDMIGGAGGCAASLPAWNNAVADLELHSHGAALCTPPAWWSRGGAVEPTRGTLDRGAGGQIDACHCGGPDHRPRHVRGGEHSWAIEGIGESPALRTAFGPATPRAVVECFAVLSVLACRGAPASGVFGARPDLLPVRGGRGGVAGASRLVQGAWAQHSLVCRQHEVPPSLRNGRDSQLAVEAGACN